MCVDKGGCFGVGTDRRSVFWVLESILPFSCHACYTESGFLQTDHAGSEAPKCGSVWQCLNGGWEENRWIRVERRPQ